VATLKWHSACACGGALALTRGRAQVGERVTYLRQGHEIFADYLRENLLAKVPNTAPRDL
jgi:hypothetical protein